MLSDGYTGRYAPHELDELEADEALPPSLVLSDVIENQVLP